jgi:hypothetical protein
MRMAATSSLIGTLSTAPAVKPGPPPWVHEVPNFTEPANSMVSGWLVTYLSTPLMAPAPYSVPCGPRSTSMWLRSSMPMSIGVLPPFAPDELSPVATSSTYTPTVAMPCTGPMVSPRMVSVPPTLPVLVRFTPGCSAT